MDTAARNHLEALRQAFEQDAQRRRDEASAMSPLERMSLGLQLGRSAPTSPAIEQELDRRALAQADLHRIWRRLRDRRRET
jgi:hypothetical protein